MLNQQRTCHPQPKRPGLMQSGLDAKEASEEELTGLYSRARISIYRQGSQSLVPVLNWSVSVEPPMAVVDDWPPEMALETASKYPVPTSR